MGNIGPVKRIIEVPDPVEDRPPATEPLPVQPQPDQEPVPV